MEVLHLVVLGLVQGLAEFLPVSSSGHLVLLSKIFGVQDSLFVSIILHVATLLSILVVLRKDVVQIVKKPFGKQSMLIAIATIPTAIIALVLMPILEQSFEGALLPFCFLISALILLFAQSRSKRVSEHQLGVKDALVIGVCQGFATFPGISRSGATISGGLLTGTDRQQTAKFSFLISIPIIIMSMLLEIYKIVVNKEAFAVNVAGLALAFLVAFLVGVLTIKIMLRLTAKADLKWFSLYLVLMAIISMIV